ncbi:MAG TPA: amidohydrolase [Candidatus Atribacteria bacterium]|nr:amidohydrolase [Candidatus Atribacteria bacterium]
MNDVIFKNILVINGEGEIVGSRDIAIREGVISKISSKDLGTYAKEVIDGKQLILMPGFINAHAHAEMVYFRGMLEDMTIQDWFNKGIWVVEGGLTEDDVYWAAILAIYEMIDAGITTFADHYFFMDKVAEAVELTGIRANLSWAFFGSGEGWEEKLDKALSFTQVWHNRNRRITTSLGPHAPYTCPPDLLKEVAGIAKEEKWKIHIHAAETKEQTEESLNRYGKTPIEILEETGILESHTIIAHALGVTDRDIDILSKHRVGISYVPKTYMKLSMGAGRVLELMEHNVPVGFGTDGQGSSNTLNIWEQMKLGALLLKFHYKDPTKFKINEIIRMGTKSAAEVLGLKDIGDIKEGYKADLITISFASPYLLPDADPRAHIIYSLQNINIRDVMVDGKFVKRNGILVGFDFDNVKREVEKRKKRLFSQEGQKLLQYYPA